MANVRHRARTFKQMSLEVAVRNPERYQGILETFNKFERRILDDDTILDIYTQLFLDGVITANSVDIERQTTNQIRQFIKDNLSHNNEWGYPTGYQAAFTRYLKTLSEFGFILSQYNMPLQLSEVAKAVVNGELSLSDAFALQSMRFWRKSPYRRVSNDFNYFAFVLKVIKARNAAGHKLSYPQFLLTLFSEDGNVSDFIKLITQNPIGDDPNKAYELAIRHFGENQKIASQSTAFRDYGNTVFRVLQLTGFITVEYDGVMLLSINTGKANLMNQLFALNFSLPNDCYEDETKYFNHLGTFDPSLQQLFASSLNQGNPSTNQYHIKLQKIINDYKLDTTKIAKMLRNVSDGGNTDSCFWFIQPPVRFEFLLTLFLYSIYRNTYQYKPNYLCDEAGIPYSHAPGNMGDIEVYNDQRYWLIEATLIRNRNQQINNETVNLFRHIHDNNNRDKYIMLVAPYIHQDTSLLIKVAAIATILDYNSIIYASAYKTDEFIVENQNATCIENTHDSTVSFIRELITAISNINIS